MLERCPTPGEGQNESAGLPRQAGEIVGTADHYGALIKLLRQRISELNLSHETIDRLAGFPSGYTGTLMCGNKAASVYSLFTFLDVLALRPLLVHDAEQLERLKQHSDWVENRRAPGQRLRRRHSGAIRIVLRPDFLRQIGRKGAKARALLQSKRRAQTEAARAARWSRHNGAVV